MAITELRQRALHDAHALAMHLKQHLVEEGLVTKEISSQIGRAPQYLTRVFGARFPLKLKDLFGIFYQLEKNPRRFLFRFYPPGGGDLMAALDPKNLAKLPGGALFNELVQRHLFGDAPLPPALVVERAGRILRGLIAASPKSQRHVSRELGLPEDALGQALRLRTGLDAWHVFGILTATDSSPARFFHEITEPEDKTLDPAMFSRVTGLAARAGKAGKARKTTKPRAKKVATTGKSSAAVADKRAGRTKRRAGTPKKRRGSKPH